MIRIRKDIKLAGALAGDLGKRALASSLEPVPHFDPEHTPLTAAMMTYVLDFDAARMKQSLPAFEVQERIKGLRGVAAGLFAFWRSLAGLLILLGLVVSLGNLARAIGPLGDAFQKLGDDQRIVRSATEGPAPDAAQQSGIIELSMSRVVGAARQGFIYSMAFILAAALLLVWVLYEQKTAAVAVVYFGAWAEKAYREALPEQASAEGGLTQSRRDEDAFGDLIRAINDLKYSLDAQKDFSNTMNDVRNAIVKSLDAMPGHIQASMGMVSKDMVRSLERNMQEEVESIKKILAIYGQQEFRIDEIRQHVEAVKGFTEDISTTVQTLEGLPAHLEATEKGLEGHTAAAHRIDASVQQLERAVLAIPSEELRTAVAELIKATSPIGRTQALAVEAITELQRRNAAGEAQDSELGARIETITTISQQFLGAYDGMTGRAQASERMLAESLERVSIQIVREAKAIRDQWSDAALAEQLGRLEKAISQMGGILHETRNSLPVARQLVMQDLTGLVDDSEGKVPVYDMTLNAPLFQPTYSADSGKSDEGGA